MPLRLSGNVAVITGGTSGIGEATAELFVEQGAQVVFTGRNVSKGHEIEHRLGGSARFVECDVRSEADVATSISRAVEVYGRVDCLFNNAGGGTNGSLETVTDAEFHDAMSLLLGSVVFGIKHAVPVMKR